MIHRLKRVSNQRLRHQVKCHNWTCTPSSATSPSNRKPATNTFRPSAAVRCRPSANHRKRLTRVSVKPSRYTAAISARIRNRFKTPRDVDSVGGREAQTRMRGGAARSEARVVGIPQTSLSVAHEPANQPVAHYKPPPEAFWASVL